MQLKRNSQISFIQQSHKEKMLKLNLRAGPEHQNQRAKMTHLDKHKNINGVPKARAQKRNKIFVLPYLTLTQASLPPPTQTKRKTSGYLPLKQERHSRT